MRSISKPEYVPFILKTLDNLKKGTEKQVLENVYESMKDNFHPADLVILPNGEPRWRNQAQNMIDGLIESGYIVKENGSLKLSIK
jgi:hypothetical protein